MKRNLTLLLILAALHSASAAAQTYYFAIRPDGKTGSGTQSDPYDGSAYSYNSSGIPQPGSNGFISKYDCQMHQLTSTQNGNTYEFVLGPGTYFTYGDYCESDTAIATKGYMLQPNTTLRGAGEGVTIIKYMGWGPSDIMIHSVICAGNYSGNNFTWRSVDYDNVTVANLTVDCNAWNWAYLTDPNNSKNDGVAIYGVALAGSSCTIRHVEVLSPYAGTSFHPKDKYWGSGLESFAISIQAVSRDATNLLIDSCTVRNSLGNYVDGIMLGGSPDGAYHVSGVISNNLVIGGSNPLNYPYLGYSVNGCGGAGVVVTNNIAQNCQYGFRNDTLPINNLTLTGNTFSVTTSAFAISSSNKTGYPITNLTLSGNTFSASGSGNGVLDFNSKSSIAGLTIRGNVISSKTSSYPGLYLGNRTRGSTYSNIVYSNNTSSLSIQNCTRTPIERDQTSEPPPGTIMDYAGSIIPTRWLICHGQAVSRKTYSSLYAALGGVSSPYGQGNGTSTFNLPDAREQTAAINDKGDRPTSGEAGHHIVHRPIHFQRLIKY